MTKLVIRLALLACATSTIVLTQTPTVTRVDNFLGFLGGRGLSPGGLAKVEGVNLTGNIVSVEVGGKQAGLVNPQRADAIQIPVDLPAGPASLVVNTTAGSSAPFALTLDEYSPAIKYELPPCYNRASPGDVVTTIAIGLGRADPAITTGVIPPLRIPTVVKPAVIVGGQLADVIDSVLTNWFLGMYEVRFRVPRSVPEGTQLVAVSIGGRTSNVAALEIHPLALEFPAPVSAAPGSVSFAARCGGRLADSAVTADPRNPPFVLGGTIVKVKDSAGVERPAQIQSATPSKVSYVVPLDTAPGTATLTLTSGREVLTTTLTIRCIVPSIFCGEDWECGFPLALVMRTRNGVQTFERVGEELGPPIPGVCCGNYRHIPIDLGPKTDEVHLLLFGTGLRFRNSLADVRLSLFAYETPTSPSWSTTLPVDYAGPQNQFAGWDQVNVMLPRSLAGRGPVVIDVLVEGVSSTYTYVVFK